MKKILDITPEVELAIEKRRSEDRKEYQSIFASKWVENAFSWAMYFVGGVILAAVIAAASQFIGK